MEVFNGSFLFQYSLITGQDANLIIFCAFLWHSSTLDGSVAQRQWALKVLAARGCLSILLAVPGCLPTALAALWRSMTVDSHSRLPINAPSRSSALHGCWRPPQATPECCWLLLFIPHGSGRPCFLSFSLLGTRQGLLCAVERPPSSCCTNPSTVSLLKI